MQNIARLVEQWSSGILIALIFAACWSMFDVWKEFSRIHAWRHDALIYLQSYDEKLLTEGRWINFALFDTLRRANPIVSAILHALSLGWFAAFCATRISGDRLYGALIGVLATTSIPLYLQLLWPLNSLPAFLILASAPLLFSYITRRLFFCLYGLLLFGSLSSLYFLLPLLFIPWAVSLNGSLHERTLKLMRKLVLPWVAGYFVGFLGASIVVGLTFGQWGMQVAEWRNGNPANDVDSLLTNIAIAMGYLFDHLVYHIEYTGWAVNVSVLMVFVAAYRSRRPTLHLWIPTLTILALYASIIPFSVALSYRTALILSMGMIFLLLVPCKLTHGERLPFGAVVMILTVVQCSAVASDLNWFRSSSNFYRSELKQVAQRPLNQYRGIMMLSDRREMQIAERRIDAQLNLSRGPGIKTLGDHRRWRSLVLDLGAPRVVLCANERAQKPCNTIILSDQSTWLSSPSGLYNAMEHPSGWLIVRIQG